MTPTIQSGLRVHRYGVQIRVARQLNVDTSLVSKIARGLYHPRTAKGARTMARVLEALRRESRDVPADVLTDPVSVERVAFVKSLPCIAAHARDCDGPIENTHTIGGGMGRRSDADHIVPCCRRHHHELHTAGKPFFEMHRCVNLRACAAETERAWQASRGDEPGHVITSDPAFDVGLVE